MSTKNERALSVNCKQRGVVRASLTRLKTRVKEFESKGTEISVGDRLAAQRLLQKLDTLDSDFRSHHFAVVDLVDEEAMNTEQRVLDEHSGSADPHVRLSKRLRRVDTDLESVVSAIESIGPDSTSPPSV